MEGAIKDTAEKIREPLRSNKTFPDKNKLQELNGTIIYELHVGGFTRSPTSGVKVPGTFSGVIEKIPYLKELGITAVELMPVFDFDDKKIPMEGSNIGAIIRYVFLLLTAAIV